MAVWPREGGEVSPRRITIGLVAPLVLSFALAPTAYAGVTARPDRGAVKGSISDSGGRLLRNVAVSLERQSGSRWRRVRSGRTSAFGTYSLAGTGPARYRSVARVDGRAARSPVVAIGPASAPEFIVIFKPSVRSPRELARDQTRRFRRSPRLVFSSALKGYVVGLTSAERRTLSRDSRVASIVADRDIEADRVVRPPAEVFPPPPSQILPTGVDRVEADRSPTARIDGRDERVNVNVAVIDTGIGRSSDLNVVGGKNCASGSRYDVPDNGHGTHVAGTIAAKDNGIGVVGVAPGAPIWSVRVLNENGGGKWSYVLCGLDWVDARSPGRGGRIRVANMSLGSLGGDSPTCGLVATANGVRVGDPLHEAVCRLQQHGVVVTVSAGNAYGAPLDRYRPAAYDQVITTTALADYDGRAFGLGPNHCPPEPRPNGTGTQSVGHGPDDTFASFSNRTQPGDLAHVLGAPGACILSTFPGNEYARLDGTSMASPHVAGAAALYIARHGGTFDRVLFGLRQRGEAQDQGHTTLGAHPERVLIVGDL